MEIKRQGPDVGYRKATTAKTCDNCEYMNPDGSCDKIYGQVKPDYVCNLHSPKSRG